MTWLDLLAPVPPAARKMAAPVPWRARLGLVWRAPPAVNAYVAPYLRAAEGLAFVLRGYPVQWTGGHVRADGTLDLARLVYATTDITAVEVPTVVPGGVHRLASWVATARLLGLHFAVEQAKREHGWMQEARRRLRRRG